MTYREWITATLSPFDVDKSTIDLILVNQSALIPQSDDEVHVDTARRAVCNEFATLLPLYSSVSEGGMSISWNYEAVKQWYELTCKQVGIKPITKPQLRCRSVW